MPPLPENTSSLDTHGSHDHITNAKDDDDEDALAASNGSSDGKLGATAHEEEHHGKYDHPNSDEVAHPTSNKK